MEVTLALLVQGIRVISPVQFIVKVNSQMFVFATISMSKPWMFTGVICGDLEIYGPIDWKWLNVFGLFPSPL